MENMLLNVQVVIEKAYRLKGNAVCRKKTTVWYCECK